MDLTIFKNSFSSLGGLEKQTLRIILYFAQKMEVEVLTFSLPGQVFNHVHFEKFSPLFLTGSLKLLYFDHLCRRWQKKHPSRITLGIDRTTAQTHLRLGNGLHKAYLDKTGAFPLTLRHQTILFLEKKAFLNPSLKKVIVNSHMVKEELEKFYHFDPNRISVIHNGVEFYDLEKSFKEIPLAKKGLQKEFHLPVVPTLLFIGNGYERKGLKRLLVALSKLREEFILLVIGKDKNEIYYKELAIRLDLKQKIFFLGPQQNVLDFYRLADTFVLPTGYDPFANTVVEALAMGLFVITTRHNGAKEVINGESGTIIDDSEESLLLALKKALSLKRDPYSIRQSVEHLDFENQLPKLERVLYE